MGSGAAKQISLGPQPDDDDFSVNPAATKKVSLSEKKEKQPPRMPGKDKYIKNSGAVVMEDSPKSGRKGAGEQSLGMLLLFCSPRTDDLIISYRENSTGAIYAKRMTDKELLASKEAAGITFPWGPFFKSLASDVLKNKAIVRSTDRETREVSFTILNSKELDVKYNYVCELTMVSGSGSLINRGAVTEYFVEPLSCMLQLRSRDSPASNRGISLDELTCELTVKKASLQQYQKKVDHLLSIVRPMREEASIASEKTMSLALEAKSLERKLYLMQRLPSHKNPLDLLYDEGGPQHFQHVPQAEDYYPIEEVVDQGIVACIRAAFPSISDININDISTVFDRPELLSGLSDTSLKLARGIFNIYRGVDRWDYDTIQLETLTNGNSLFYTTYMLLYKLNLVSHFKLDDKVLQRFLIGVQAGYHPNPYHNAMHAADVTHINYYIMMIAGLREKCELTQEEILAGIIAGAIHDYDHPGLNNNFHTKTNAYLSTLYNDRSILENHHVASIFELILNPAYNVFAPLSKEQMTVVRETMIEMVLATDMGNHGRIFKDFQLRMRETSDWKTSKEDVRLALSMSIKMADISNCARPNYIYTEWAKNIAREFYNQGDAEEAYGLPISPFMDRRKEMIDFPKGQISFMMYIVVPMVEAISEFLPSLRFALQHCNENKEVWQNYQEEHKKKKV